MTAATLNTSPATALPIFQGVRYACIFIEVSTLACLVPHSTYVLEAAPMERSSGLNGLCRKGDGNGRVGSGTVFLPSIAPQPPPEAKKRIGEFLRTLPTFTPSFCKTDRTNALTASAGEQIC